MTERQNEQEQDREDKRRLSDNVDGIMNKVNEVVREAITESVDAAESIGGNIMETVDRARSNRSNVVMVRVDKASLERLDELVESGIMGSRSEAAAFLIGEGIKARQGLFDRIAEKIQEIRQAKDELRNLVDEDGG